MLCSPHHVSFGQFEGRGTNDVLREKRIKSVRKKFFDVDSDIILGRGLFCGVFLS